MERRITVRLPEHLVGYLETQAEAGARSLHAEILRRLDESQAMDEKPYVLGWVKLARWGELDEDECGECGQDLARANAYIALLSNGQHYGPVCSACATNE